MIIHCSLHTLLTPFYDARTDCSLYGSFLPYCLCSLCQSLLFVFTPCWLCSLSVLTVCAHSPLSVLTGGDFHREDENFFRALAPVLCTALENVSSHEQAAKTSQDALRLLNTVGSILDATSVPSLCDQVGT